MAAATVGYSTANNVSTSLTVYNIPFTADEGELHLLFPSARHLRILRNESYPASSQNTCVLQFSSTNDCHKAFAECQEGKELGGRMLHAVLGEATEYGQLHAQSQQPIQESDYSHEHQRRDGPYSLTKPYTETGRGGAASRGRYQEGDRFNGDAILVVSNLPYTTTERDLEKEFRDACSITLNRDDRGRSSGVAHLSFRTREQCDAALHACNGKTLNGRALRGRITSGQSNSGNMQRNYENRPNQGRNDSGNMQRHFDNRSPRGRSDSGTMQRNFDDRSGQGRADSGNMQRSFDNRSGQGRMDSGNMRGNYDNRSGQQSNYNSNRRDFDDGRRGRGGAWGGSRGYSDGGKDFNRGRPDRFGARRERSPTQGEPVRGYAASKGFRITSAVIQGARSPSSQSSSDED